MIRREEVNIIEEFQKLASELRSNYPGLLVAITEFSAGSILLEVELGEGIIEMEYRYGRDYGVSFLKGIINPFGIGHDYIFDNFKDASMCTNELVRANV